MDWVNVYTTNMPEATVIKSKLESENIPVMLKYESFGKITGLNIDGIGEVNIWVPEDYREQVLEIINNAKKEDL